MVNLFNETLEIIQNNGKIAEEIKFVSASIEKYENGTFQTYNYYMKWEDFVEQANKVYDDGYGGTEVKMGLKIVGKNWWLERHEYDGSEWWEFKSLPKKPKAYKKFNPFRESGEW